MLHAASLVRNHEVPFGIWSLGKEFTLVRRGWLWSRLKASRERDLDVIERMERGPMLKRDMIIKILIFNHLEATQVIRV